MGIRDLQWELRIARCSRTRNKWTPRSIRSCRCNVHCSTIHFCVPINKKTTNQLQFSTIMNLPKLRNHLMHLYLHLFLLFSVSLVLKVRTQKWITTNKQKKRSNKLPKGNENGVGRKKKKKKMFSSAFWV